MSFRLSSNLDVGPREAMQAFEEYRQYVQRHRAAFPPGAYELASSGWYFDFNDHRCPHDAWLESVTLEEVGHGPQHSERSLNIRARLLGAYHDCYIEMFYPVVYSYSMVNGSTPKGNRDWRYDEFRVSESGHLIHEIEWAGDAAEGARWIIDASDIEFKVIPMGVLDRTS